MTSIPFKNFIKQVGSYLLWTLVSILLSFGYVRIQLGSKPEETSGFMKFLNLVYELIMIHVAPIIGCVIALIFILTDLFFLKKKLKNITRVKRFCVRLLYLILLTAITGGLHYYFEKVLDII